MDKLQDALYMVHFIRNGNEYFSIWSLRITAVLEGKGIHDVVQGLEDELLKENANVHALYSGNVWMAREAIVTVTSEDPLTPIKNTKSPTAMWYKMKARYEIVSTANKISHLMSKINSRYRAEKELVTISRAENKFQ